ncbi:hypothetical protein E5D57_008364 [Metarhizium anisopliae]|nr:hypothetical protein E5D57_008364 [Metarhizium anisopliae]
MECHNPAPIQPRLDERSQGVSVAQWNAVPMNMAKKAEGGSATPTSELERWLETRQIRFDVSIVKPRDFLQKGWKEHKDKRRRAISSLSPGPKLA